LALKNIRLTIQYDGTEFCGWQYQPGKPTIQGEIERAIARVTGQKATVYGAGRTDSGVHALGQVANFNTDHYLVPEKFKDALNFYLPRSVVIVRSDLVPESFHARRSARWRRYRYLIGLERSALYYRFRWEHLYPLNLERMKEIAASIVDIHDFSAFCVVSSRKNNCHCRVISAEWQRRESALIFEICADRFLHTMVRSLVGAMVDAGKDKDYLTLDKFKDILHSGDHRRIKTVVPARGLYLVEVGY
jgi:tRNA pseudouridine38-40 synthase